MEYTNMSKLEENGQLGDDGLNEIIKDMEKLEEDLVNKRITRQTIERNKEIVSRMLESQKAAGKAHGFRALHHDVPSADSWPDSPLL